jgi:hypothetical protein
MRRTLPRVSRRLVLAAVTVAAVALPAAAQQGAEETGPPTMPRPKFADKPPVLLNMVLAVALAFAVAAPNFIPSKRGHQD